MSTLTCLRRPFRTKWRYRLAEFVPVACRRSYQRPTFAPKPVLDYKHIALSSALYEQNCIDRNYAHLAKHAIRIAQLRDENARIDKEIREPRAQFKQLQQEIQNVQEQAQPGATDDGDGLLSTLERARLRAKEIKEYLDGKSRTQKQNVDQLEAMALALPNLSSVHTPVGTQAKILDVVENLGDDKHLMHEKSHVDIGAQLGILNFSQAVKSSGWGWYYLLHEGALLEQALVQFAISNLVQRGWQIVSPPTVTYAHVANACGFQPRDQNGEQQVYSLERSETDQENPEPISHVLTGTSEIPLAALHADSEIKDRDLPLKTAAVTRCYRAEAGARGANTKGLYRVHEFTKVEMFAWTMPDRRNDGPSGTFDTSGEPRTQCEDVYNEMLEVQRKTLTDLGLNFQILEMPTADLGASATRKIDMEAFFPSRRDRDGGWGEVTSASICTDYQTRRLRTRYSQTGTGHMGWPWTLNGTAMAVPRIVAALLECHWDEEHQLMPIPAALKPWMHGIDVIEARRGSPPLRAFA